eukprot:g21186.t1
MISYVVQADEGHVRTSFVDALKNWRANLRKSRSGGEDTSDSALKLWQAKRAQIEKEMKESEKEEPDEVIPGKVKKPKIETEEHEATKLNRSPTKVLLLTNFATASEGEEEIQENAEKLVESFGKVQQCKILKVPDVPDEDAVRVFLLFESVQVSSKAYAALRGQVLDGRALRARFYDEHRFNEGDLQKLSSKGKT